MPTEQPRQGGVLDRARNPNREARLAPPTLVRARWLGETTSVPRRTPEKKRLLATVLFTDIVNSTKLAEELGDTRWRQLLVTHHAIMRRTLNRHHGREIDTAGDGFFATFDQPSGAIECAEEMIERLRRIDVHIRAGVHMGEVEVMGPKVSGIAVHIGARVMSMAGAGQVLISSTVRDLTAGSDLDFEDFGVHELKGVAAQMHLFSVRQVPAVTEAAGPLLLEPEPEPAARRRVALVTGSLALVAAAAILVAVVSLRGSGDAAFVPAPNTVAEFDPSTGKVIGGVHVGTTPTALAYGDGKLWVANFDDKTIQSIDVSTRTAGPAMGGVLANPTGIAVGDGLVWVTNGFAGQVVKIDPSQANSAEPIAVGSGVQGIAYGFGVVWIAQSNQGTLLRLDPVTDSVKRVPLAEGAEPVDVAVGGGSVWVTDGQGGRVFEVDPQSLEVEGSVPLLEGQPSRVAFGDGFVWVTSTDSNSLTRIDPASGQFTTVENVGNGPLGVAAGPGGVWVANSRDGTVARVDPSSAEVVGRIRLGFSPDDVAVAPGGVWVSLHQP
jgi:class 3 adenylate cyclase/streptogramin lyase